MNYVHFSDTEELAQVESNTRDVFDEATEIMVSRHQKYGKGNINEFGLTGVVVRMGDKWARIKNGHDHHDESLIDGFIDMMNYCNIGIQLIRGQWPGQEPVETREVGWVRRRREAEEKLGGVLKYGAESGPALPGGTLMNEGNRE